MKNKVTYSYIRSHSPLGDYRGNVFIEHFFSARFSPFFTTLFIKLGVTPNIITLLMIVSGLCGALVFSFENIWFKIFGYAFILLWFILDCSDGEVARITKNFSMMGKELDYVAHTINHPFFIMSYGYSIFLMGVDDSSLFLSLFLILVLDLMHRSIMGLDLLFQLKSESESDVFGRGRLSFIKYLISNATLLPNFVTFFPLLFLISTLLETDFFSLYVYLTALCYLVVVPRILITITLKFVRS